MMKMVIEMLVMSTPLRIWMMQENLTDVQKLKPKTKLLQNSKQREMIKALFKVGHLGQRAQPAVQAVLVKQQAKLVKLRIPPILLTSHLLVFLLLVKTSPKNPPSLFSLP